MTIAPTGAGKGRDVIIPNLLTYTGSVVVFDPKGENYDVTHDYRRKVLGQKIVALDPFMISAAAGPDSFNPFDVFEEVNAPASSAQDVGDFGRLISDMLLGGQPSLKEPFWDNMAQMLIAAVTSDLMTDESRPNTLEEIRKSVFSDDLQSEMRFVLDTRSESLPPGAVQEYAMLVGQDSTRTFPSIVVTAAQQLGPFGGAQVTKATRNTSFTLADLTSPDTPISVYIIIPPHKLRTHQGLLRVWIGSLLYLIMNRSGPRSSLLFMIDEAAQLGRFSLLEEAVTLLRGYGLRTWTFWQDLAQMFSLYERSAETMINNSGVLQVFGTANLGAATRMSTLLGFAADDLIRLSDGEQMVAFKNEWPAIVERISYLDEPTLRKRAKPNPRHD